MFRVGLALDIFEAVRPFGILFADYFFFASLVFLLCSSERRRMTSWGSGVLLAGGLILGGVLVSGVTTGPALRVIILFGAFAPLALAHSRDLWRNLRYLVAGITVNCAIAIVAAWIWPGIVEALWIDSRIPDFGEESGRFAGLSGHPNSLGISAALAVLVAVGLLRHDSTKRLRIGTYLQILICTVGAVLSSSRTFFVALAPALLILILWQTLNLKRMVRLSFKLAFLASILWLFANYLFPLLSGSYLQRLGETDESYVANRDRLVTGVLAVAQISQRPMTGWGMEHFGEAGMIFIPEEGGLLPAHVVILHYWFAEGILGGLGIALLFVLPVVKMVRALRDSRAKHLSDALRLGVCVYVSLFISSNLHPVLLNRFLFMPLFLFAGILTLRPRRPPKSSAPGMPPAWGMEAART